MKLQTEPQFKKIWQAVAMGAHTEQDRIPIDMATYRNAVKGTGLRVMPRDELHRKKFAHPMYARTFLVIDETTHTLEISADSESYIGQFAEDLGLPSYRRE